MLPISVGHARGDAPHVGCSVYGDRARLSKVVGHTARPRTLLEDEGYQRGQSDVELRPRQSDPVEERGALKASLRRAADELVRLDNGHYIRHCRRAPEGCPARLDHYVDLVVNASDLWGVDPWLILAKMQLSSGLDPARVHRVTGAFGLIAVHPLSTLAKECWPYSVTAAGTCMRRNISSEATVLLFSAFLARQAAVCSSLDSALMAWSTGYCQKSMHPLWQKKVTLIHRTAEKLKQLGQAESHADN